MRIDPKTVIGGVAALQVRDALRRASRDGSFDVDTLAGELKMPIAGVTVVLNELIAKKYVEIQAQKSKSDRPYALSVAGRQFSLASGARALSKASAAKKLAEFLRRVKLVNANPDYISQVSKVFIFGSFLSDAQQLSDVDIAIQLERRYLGKAYTEKADERIGIAEAGGRSFSNMLDRLAWPEREVRLFLTGSMRGLSLHDADELTRLGCPYKEVFPNNELTSDSELNKALDALRFAGSSESHEPT